MAEAIVEGYTEEQMIEKAKKKIEKKPRLKHRNGLVYFVKECYPHFVLMNTEFGFRRCFKYSEVLFDMA